MEIFRLGHLQVLESEAIAILREVAAQFQRPALLYSVGKDSSVLLHLARKAFYPARIPFPLLHIDTGFKFSEMYEFRDRAAKKHQAELIVYRNTSNEGTKANPFSLGTQRCCGILKTRALLDALQKFGCDAAIGGARRDEERSRAKERVFSVRDVFGQWQPRSQRPELWDLYNGLLAAGESMRVFPLSNWTELDVWAYIEKEKIEVVPLYFAKTRSVIARGGQLIPVEGFVHLGQPAEQAMNATVRYRTLGCMPCTGAIRSSATNVSEVIAEMMATKTSERSTRVIDHDTEASMEQKKREGYF